IAAGEHKGGGCQRIEGEFPQSEADFARIDVFFLECGEGGQVKTGAMGASHRGIFDDRDLRVVFAEPDIAERARDRELLGFGGLSGSGSCAENRGQSAQGGKGEKDGAAGGHGLSVFHRREGNGFINRGGLEKASRFRRRDLSEQGFPRQDARATPQALDRLGSQLWSVLLRQIRVRAAVKGRAQKFCARDPV
ncbi:MAG: hypothetical protein RLZZ496_907, partial [Pseudomonadota bacterium]